MATWAPATIAQVANVPVGSVYRNWPLLIGALERRGIADDPVVAVAIATVAIETASTFEPVREAFWLSEDWRKANLRYYPWYGRGFIQLTWESNYEAYGPLVGVDLIEDPDRAMIPQVAADVLAEFFLRRGVADAARQRDWREARRLVQGADAGLPRLIAITEAMLATPQDQPLRETPEDWPWPTWREAAINYRAIADELGGRVPGNDSITVRLQSIQTRVDHAIRILQADE